MKVNDGCLEFREGFCGWDNTKQGSRLWRQTTKQGMERLTISNPGSGKDLLLVHNIYPYQRVY